MVLLPVRSFISPPNAHFGKRRPKLFCGWPPGEGSQKYVVSLHCDCFSLMVDYQPAMLLAMDVIINTTAPMDRLFIATTDQMLLMDPAYCVALALAFQQTYNCTEAHHLSDKKQRAYATPTKRKPMRTRIFTCTTLSNTTRSASVCRPPCRAHGLTTGDWTHPMSHF
jgi:hypothetical protein